MVKQIHLYTQTSTANTSKGKAFSCHWTVTPTMKPWPYVHYSGEFLVSAGTSNWGKTSTLREAVPFLMSVSVGTQAKSDLLII